jgi:toxin FitB
VTYVVIDTDVASKILKHQLTDDLGVKLAGATLAVTFVTIGELTMWSVVRAWGANRRAAVDRFLTRAVVLPYSERVATVWGELQGHAHNRGRRRPVNDTWIAACCLARDLPLATLNGKDFVDFADHEGLRLLT